MLKQGWHAVLTKTKQDSSTSFIGGKPCIPRGEPLPMCKVCGEPLTFFFQIAFPEGHMWAGKSLAFFYCTCACHKHDDKQQFPPAINTGATDDLFNIPDGEINPETYQTLFRAIFFDTADGVLREEYQEKVVYQRIDWKASRKKNKKTPIIIAGEAVWSANYGKERPASYEGKPMELVLQVAEYFNFEKLDDAPPEMEETYQKDNPFKSREENDYTFFFDFNRVYLWGTVEPEHPSFWLNVQNDI